MCVCSLEQFLVVNGRDRVKMIGLFLFLLFPGAKETGNICWEHNSAWGASLCVRGRIAICSLCNKKNAWAGRLARAGDQGLRVYPTHY